MKGELTSRIGRLVTFRAPQDVHVKGGAGHKGEIVDEVWVDAEINKSPPHERPCDEHCWGDYSFCSQLIKWSDGTHTIRLAYYRRRCGEDAWEYASQMTVNSAPETIHSLLTQTLAKGRWFPGDPSN
jgi:hypothetical protein